MSEIELLIAQKDALTKCIRGIENDPNEKKRLIDECKKLGSRIKELRPPKDPILHAQQQQQKKNLITVECENCGNDFQTSGKTRICVVYCKGCRPLRQTDILEYITDESFTIFTEKQLTVAENLLKSLTSDVRLDLHKTLDTLSPNTKLPTKNNCCVSYVGNLTVTRITAREDIMERIGTGQIDFGVLVFKRGSYKSEERNSFTEVGSKAWFNRLVQSTNECAVFIDDSEDHVLSVGCIDGMDSIRIAPGQQLLKLLKLLK